jgi:predicted porin
MQKKIIALAIAAALTAPAMAFAEATVYGKANLSIDMVNDGAVTNSGSTNQLTSNNSRLGFKGSEDLGGGLKAVWQIEHGLTFDGAGAMGGAGLRNTFVGVSGGFGTVLVGRHDTPYKLGGSADVFVDTAADAQKSTGIIGSGNFDARVTGTIAYISPDFSGFHFAVATVPGESTAAGTNANDLADAYSVVGVYKNGPLNASLAWEDHNDITDETAWKANVGYAFGDLTVGATYEAQSDVYGVQGRNKDAWLVSAAYAMGPISLLAQYGDRNDDASNATAGQAGSGDLTRWTLGVGYALSKRTNVYAAYNSDESNTTTGASADATTWTFGINHDF